jgi:hypothetical protein
MIGKILDALFRLSPQVDHTLHDANIKLVYTPKASLAWNAEGGFQYDLSEMRIGKPLPGKSL